MPRRGYINRYHFTNRYCINAYILNRYISRRRHPEKHMQFAAGHPAAPAVVFLSCWRSNWASATHPLADTREVDDIVEAVMALDVVVHALPPSDEALHQRTQRMVRQQPDARKSALIAHVCRECCWQIILRGTSTTTAV
jgi:hypothetical protein